MNAVAWWNTLSLRDRRALAVLAAFVALALAWFALWQPLAASRDRLAAQVERAEQDRAWMQSRATELGQLRAAGALDPLDRSGKSLLALADAGAREAGLGANLKRVEPVSEGRVNLWFEGVPFDSMTTWLDQLEGRYGVRVDDLSAERAGGVGTVNARVGLADTAQAQ
jgi:general secretion pathway protein M